MTTITRLLSGLGAFIAFLGICMPTWAQQNDVENDSTIYKMDEIIISASKYEQSPQTVGRNVTVITEQELQKSIYTSVSEVLAQQQSVHIIGVGQTPGSLQQGFIRNANSNHSVVLIDGVRISDPSTNNNSIDLAELSLVGVERIEIVRGSHSTLYGSSAIGGVINIITKKSGKQGLNIDTHTQHGGFGEDTYSTSNNLFMNYTSEQGFYVTTGANYQFTNGLDATIDTASSSGFNPQDQDDFEKLDLISEIGYQKNGYRLYGSFRRADQKVDVDQGAYNDDSNAFTEFDRNLYGYGAEAELSGNLNMSFKGSYSNLNRDFVNDSSRVSAHTYDGNYTETRGDGTLWENELKAVLGSANARVVVGISATRQTMNNFNYTYFRSGEGVYEYTTDLDSLDLKEVIYNGFVHANLEGGMLAKSLDSFALVLGGRYVNHDEFGSHFTYEISPKVQLSESTLVYGAVTSGFNAPSLYQLYSPAMGRLTNRGNENLDPEKSISYELGWKQRLNPRFSFQVSAYKTEVRDVIEYVYLWDKSTDISKLGVIDYLGDTYINLSEQDVLGLEISGSAVITPALQIDGNISFTESTLSFDPDEVDLTYTEGNHVQLYQSGAFVTREQEIDGFTRRPAVNAFVSADYAATENLNLTIDSRFVGSKDDVYYSAGLGPLGAVDRRNVDHYNVTDLSVRYQFSGQLSVTGKVENIFDTDYQEIKGYQTRGRGFYLKLRYQL